MTEVYALAEKAFGGNGEKVLASVINHIYGPINSGDDIVPDLVLENLIKKTLMGIGAYNCLWMYFSCDRSLIDSIPKEDLPLYLNFKLGKDIHEYILQRFQRKTP